MHPRLGALRPLLPRRLLVLSLGFLIGCATPELVQLPKAGTGLLIRNVDVFSAVPGRPLLRNQDVLIREGRIVAVEGRRLEAPGARVVDGSGQTLLPGLIDFHTHVRGGMVIPWKPLMLPTFEHNLQAALFSGIMAIVDLSGEDTTTMQGFAADLAAGRLVGPRLFTAGKGFTVADGHPKRMMATVKKRVPCILRPFLPEVAIAADESPQRLESHLAAAPHFTKVYVDRIPMTARLMPDALLKSIVTASHKKGVPVIAHVGSSENLSAAARAGADGAAHIVYKDEIPATLADELARKKMFVVPTLVVWDNLHQFTNQKRSDHFLPIERATMPADRLAALAERREVPPLDEDWKAFNEIVARGNPLIFKNTATLKQAGVRIVAGSDSPNLGLAMGGSLHRELVLLVRAGLTPTEALLAATSVPAGILGVEQELGSVVVGRRANVFLVRGDPTKNIAATQAITTVIYSGRILERSAR